MEIRIQLMQEILYFVIFMPNFCFKAGAPKFLWYKTEPQSYWMLSLAASGMKADSCAHGMVYTRVDCYSQVGGASQNVGIRIFSLSQKLKIFVNLSI